MEKKIKTNELTELTMELIGIYNHLTSYLTYDKVLECEKKLHEWIYQHQDKFKNNIDLDILTKRIIDNCVSELEFIREGE